MNNDFFIKSETFKLTKSFFNFDERLPNMVFKGSWESFLFFDCDHIFRPNFISIVNDFMALDGASVSCIFNIDIYEDISIQDSSKIFIDNSVNGLDYMSQLRGEGPATGWLYRVDQYICSSNIGGWCIFADKSNDVAIIALRRRQEKEMFAKPLSDLGALPIRDMIYTGVNPTFPYDRLVEDWREKLVANYC